MKKQNKTVKQKVEWTVLGLLIVAIGVSVWSNLFTYEYYYFKCQGKPTEVFGQYYRIPYDKGYGIHPGSDYSNCSYSPPAGKIRDPSTTAGAAQIAQTSKPKLNYDIYIPDGYVFSKPSTIGGGSGETDFTITAKSNATFRVREMNKDSNFSYTNLCLKPIDENWSGTVVGKDGEGRDICHVNPSKYVTNYVVGINIGRTGIMLETSNGSEGLLEPEVTSIFGSMKLLSE